MSPSTNAGNSPLSLGTTKSVQSWKPMGSTRLVFSASESLNYGTLECSLSSSATTTPADTIHMTPAAPKTLLSERIVPFSRQQEQGGFLLQSTTSQDENLNMKTINAMLLSFKSAMLFQDGEDFSRKFLYAPRSLHTASLTEYNPHSFKHHKTKSPKEVKKQVVVESPETVCQVNNKENEETNLQVAAEKEANDAQELAEVVKAVDPMKLKELYKSCLESGEPTPHTFGQIVLKSLELNKDVAILGDLLVTFAQIQQDQQGDTRRLLQMQTSIRLVLATNCKFLKLHHQLTYKSVPNKKLRKKLKKTSPDKVLEDQVLNLLSLLAIRCDLPADFRVLVKELCVGVSEDFVQTILEYFELNDEEEEEEERREENSPVKEQLPAVTPTTAAKPPEQQEPLSPKQELFLLPQSNLKEEPKEAEDGNELSILKQSVSLTQSRSTRKNSLVPNQKRKYVGSHFGAGLSNVSTLFRQVKVPVAPAAAARPPKKRPQAQLPIKLEPRRTRPSKRPRTISFQLAKKVISETPAKQRLYASPHSLSPIGGRSDSQNARLVAQEALAAARRKL